MGLARAVDRVVKAHVGVSEGRADGIRRLGQLAHRGQQLFLRRREDVRLAAADALDGAAVGLEGGAVFKKARELVVVDGEQLRRREGRGPRDGHGAGGRLAAHVAPLAVGQVLVALAVGVAHQPLEPHAQRVAELEPVEQPARPFAERAREGRKLLGAVRQRPELLRPGLVVGEEVAQVPGVLHGDLAARGDFRNVHNSLRIAI